MPVIDVTSGIDTLTLTPGSRSTYVMTSPEGEKFTAAGPRATLVGTYASAEALQQVLDMGVVEGASSAINQIDGPLATG